ncbi:primosomal replication protein [Shewanella sp. A32]|uniref:primosomal replication protein n=1 Tax=Shewanella sp. A32 TaxID=3031327 RepID=UPI0023B988A4|nr:primosomal replication protein [Shewanella sp. A32]MDF0533572.1 primosomal replication protein [Shewanella sp. A32]
MNQQQLVSKLREQLVQLEQQVLQHDASLPAKDNKLLAHLERFNDELFHQNGAKLAPCVQQLRDNINQLEKQLQLQMSAATVSRTCEKIQDRFSALKRAMATTAIDVKEQQQQKLSKQRYFQQKQSLHHEQSGFNWIASQVMSSSHKLYDELNKHLNWEKKILFKIEQLQSQLDTCHSTAKIAVQNDLLLMHRRLGKCRQAISYIEDRIQTFERPQQNNHR